ncbi:MAG TPA: glycosyltransferase [Tepidisphaeraceae bacterium]|nr:glycosyltransferase [Tepidisphaeraceae bacterium]
MEAGIVTLNWQRMSLLSARFQDNCAALATRDAALAGRLRAHVPSGEFVIAGDGDELRIGKLSDGLVVPLVYRINPAGSRQILSKLCPKGEYADPVLVAGLDQGWLWQMVHELPCRVAIRPGYRPPVFYLARSVEQLWLACHLHDWRAMLADARVHLFVGDGCAAEMEAALAADARLAGPRVSVTLDGGVWPAGMNLDVANARVAARLQARMDAAVRSFGSRAPAWPLRPEDLGRPIRVMGVTSRYTTFLQHSMRDWLAAFDAAGHETRLIIEAADHEQLSSLVLAEEAAEFEPDLIVLIDHFRGELGGLPAHVPCVMWVQDRLTSIYCAAAGAMQGPTDFVIGYGRAECTRQHGYPPERFMATMAAVNEARFAAPELSAGDVERYACDVSFVSHASRPAEAFVAEQIERNPRAKALLTDAFERLKSIYDDGMCVSHPLHVRGVIREAMAATGDVLDAASLDRVTDVFSQQVNNALLRHQMLEWTAETGVDLRLYGNGWEKHPRLAEYARGPADHQGDLRKIYRASRMNLQATPHGAVHQRTLEGLCAGGFFLMRYVPGDRVGQIYQPLWAWCEREGIETDEELLRHATPEVLKMLGEFQRTVGLDPFKLGVSLMDDMRMFADVGFVQSAAVMWADEYERVAFDSRAALQQRVRHFLTHPEERAQLAEAMRGRVVEHATYGAVNRRLLEFVSRGMARSTSVSRAA